GSFVVHGSDPAAGGTRGASGGDPEATLISARPDTGGHSPWSVAAGRVTIEGHHRGGDITATVSPPTRRLYRPRDHRIVAGVASGLAEHLGVPLLAVRIALVVLLGFSGLGLLLYAVFWAVLPQQVPTG